MQKLQTSETIRSLETRAQTLTVAKTLAEALVKWDVRPQVQFEPRQAAGVRQEQTDPRLRAGWLLGEGRRYLAGQGIGAARPVWAREQLMLGEDGRLRTVYEEPKRGYRKDEQSRVFHGAHVEGWDLCESTQQRMPVLAVREHDTQASRGDYFLSHTSQRGQVLPIIRREEGIDMVNEQYVQHVLGNLAMHYDVPGEPNVVGAS